MFLTVLLLQGTAIIVNDSRYNESIEIFLFAWKFQSSKIFNVLNIHMLIYEEFSVVLTYFIFF